MKKMLAALLSLALAGAAALFALAAQPPADGAPAETPETPEPPAWGLPVRVDGQETEIRASVMVPLQAVAERLGLTVTQDSGTVRVEGSERYVRLTIGENQYFAAPVREGLLGASLFSLSAAPCAAGDVICVPLELFDVLLEGGAGTAVQQDGTVTIGAAPETPDTVRLPNPFTDHDTLDQAARAAGFSLTVPEEAGGSPRRHIQTLDTEMIQVFYGDEDGEVCVRKAPGGEDISGDYNVYPQTTAADVDGAEVVMKGEEDRFHLALWTRGGYTYAILARGGMSGGAMTALIRQVR